MPDFTNDYRALMDGVRMDDSLKRRIRVAAATRGAGPAAEQAVAAASGARQARDAHDGRGATGPHLITRRRFAAIGAAAAAAVIGAVGLGVAIPSVIAARNSGQAPAGPADANSFGLLAYADTPDAAPNQVKELSMEYFCSSFDQRGGWSYSSASPESGHNDGTAACGWTFDFTCVGHSISSVTYSFGYEGTPADNAPGDFAGFYEETQIFENGERKGAESQWLGSITIPYDGDAALGSSEESDPSFHRALVASAVISEETRWYWDEYSRLFNELYYSDHDTLDELLRQFGVRESHEVALKLAETPLIVTAEFTDGTTQTKRYRIAPKDDYVEEMLGRKAQFDQTIAEGGELEGDISLPNDGDLYTITEIA